MAVVQTYEIKL